jgi:hypothetical protein
MQKKWKFFASFLVFCLILFVIVHENNMQVAQDWLICIFFLVTGEVFGVFNAVKTEEDWW